MKMEKTNTDYSEIAKYINEVGDTLNVIFDKANKSYDIGFKKKNGYPVCVKENVKRYSTVKKVAYSLGFDLV